MDSYLKGRGFKEEPKGDSSFKGLLDAQNTPAEPMQADKPDANLAQKEVIYEEEGCPKVEVVSEEGKPTTIVIHLEDGRLLEIDCVY
jgi:hypothetical protein